MKKVTSRAEPSWKYFSSSYGSSEPGSDSSLLVMLKIIFSCTIPKVKIIVGKNLSPVYHLLKFVTMTGHLTNAKIFCLLRNAKKWWRLVNVRKIQLKYTAWRRVKCVVANAKIRCLLKFIYSEKATKFCEIFLFLLTTVHC